MSKLKFDKVVLIIMDGWGHTTQTDHNAIHAAHTPFFDHAMKVYPHTYLEASGLAVGLPQGQMGNSEIGHTTIGAGSPIDTDLVTIAKSIDSGDFYNDTTLLKMINHAKKNNGRVHVMGLISDGGVHSHNSHLYAFLKMATSQGLKNDQVVMHLFTDGRDVAPGSAIHYVKELLDKAHGFGVGVIGSIGGRYFGMDRADNHDRIKHVTDLLFAKDINDIQDRCLNIHVVDHIQNTYNEKDITGKIDEYMEHVMFNYDGAIYPFAKGDSVFFINFRADRAKQISKTILEKRNEYDLNFTTMTNYGEDFDTEVVFAPAVILNTLGKQLSSLGLKHAHISESEKFPHVTYFVNGQSDLLEDGETQYKIPSRTDIKTHDEAPEMMSKEIVDKVMEVYDNNDFIIVNFPNADMVGHTGSMDAVVKAVETVDSETERLVSFVNDKGGVCLVTADHGNAEVMFDISTGKAHTAHTTNLVPVYVSSDKVQVKNDVGTLADLAPTVIDLFGAAEGGKVEDMKGQSLIL